MYCILTESLTSPLQVCCQLFCNLTESHAITGLFNILPGLCLEKIGPSTTSKFKQADLEDKVIDCFEKAGDLTLLYLEDVDSSSTDIELGIILETAIQQSPLLHMKRGYVILFLGDNHFRNSYTTTAAVTHEERVCYIVPG
jgi:hypothetical protein